MLKYSCYNARHVLLGQHGIQRSSYLGGREVGHRDRITITRRRMTRRTFLKGLGASAAALALSPRNLASLAQAAGHLLPGGYFKTSGAQIVPASGGSAVRLAGVNW
jgi:hypothetical protein